MAQTVVCLTIGIALFVIVREAFADTLVESPVSNYCASSADCGPTVSGNATICEEGVCVPPSGLRKIGTWCSRAIHCDKGTGILELTCDVRKKICVGATPNVPCIDSLVDHNTLDDIGWLLQDTLPTDRCDVGMFCDVSGNGLCLIDHGSTFIPKEKLGETAYDIRDNIRTTINILLGFLGVLGVIVVIYGGAVWMTAAGEEEKVSTGKKTLIAGVIGLIIIGVAWTIVSYIINIARDIV